jgi:hypothetical protein
MGIQSLSLVLGNQRAGFNSLISQKIENKRRVNIYFAMSYSHPNYYYLSQLFFISQLAQAKNVFVYLCLGDTILFRKKRGNFSEPFATYDKAKMDFLVREVRSVLEGFGVDSERVFVYRASENWHRLLKLGEDEIFSFFRGLNTVPSKTQNIGDKVSALFYLPKNTRYELGYVVNKYLDLFVSSNFEKLFPEDIENKIDLFITGNYSSLLIAGLHSILLEDGLISENQPIIASFPSLPCIGQSAAIDKAFCVPHWNMQVEEIYDVIEKYNTPTSHIGTILRSLIAETKTKVVFSANGEPEEFDLTKMDLKKVSLKKQRFILAYALHDFLQEAKRKTDSENGTSFLNLKGKDEIYEVGKAFNSTLTLDILALADKGHTVSEIARRLNKHTSNVSACISQLKEKGLAKTNTKGELEKAVKVIKINL